jgi:hypothetical protein
MTPTHWVHVVGAPRSGTTLMLELVRTCFAVDGSADEERSIFLPPPSGRTVCTKNPADVLVMGPVLRLLPELRVIVMVRDPRDTVVSVHGRDPRRYWTNLRMWREYHRAALRLRGDRRVLFVRYEDLVRAPSATQARIARAMPFLAPTARFDEFHVTARPSAQSREALRALRPPDDASIGRWRAHKPRLAGQLRLHGPITQELVALRYEHDATWLRELDGIVPDTTPSFWPEHPSVLRRARRRTRLWVGVTKLAVRRAGAALRGPRSTE